MKEKTCKNCIYYRQHYLLDKECCMPVNCGHCVHGRTKQRKPSHRVCEHFESQPGGASLPNREETIYFLTTEFLKRIMEKPLPPEIKEDAGFE